MRQAILVVDVQASFDPPLDLVARISAITTQLPSAATVERHDEAVTPFERQLGWRPAADDECAVTVDRVFIKHGYLPPLDVISYFRSLDVERVLVCGIQADTCVLAAGFLLFDAGLSPTLLPWLTIGSSLDRSGELGSSLWRHHFGAVIDDPAQLVI